MRVGLLTADLSGMHGWGRYGIELTQALERQGAQVTVVCASNTLPTVRPEAARLLPSILPMTSRMLLRQAALLPAVRRALHGCDVVHNTVEFYAPLAWAVAGQRPLLHTGHGTYVNLPRMRRWPVNALYRQAFVSGRMVCVSAYTQSVAQAVMPTLRTQIIRNAVHALDFAADDAHHELLVLASGGVKARKGTLELVQAMAVVRAQLPQVRCVIVGRVPSHGYGLKVRAAIAELGLQDTVELAGFVAEHELREWYRRASVFVLPSLNDGWYFEGFGLVQLEASAAGLPVITTHGSGAAEAVDDGSTGLLLHPAELAQTLPAAIVRLLTDKTLARRMGNNGILKAQRTTWDQVARDLLQVYEMPR